MTKGLCAFACLAMVTGMRSCSPTGGADRTEAVVAETDWTELRTVRLSLADFRIEPDQLVFHYGMPYRLHIINTGRREHTIEAMALFQAIAVRTLRFGEEGETSAPHFFSIHIRPGRQVELEFVPLERGDFRLNTATPGRYGKSMACRITVQ